VQVAEGALMEELSVPACASEPRGDGGLTVAEDPFGGGSIQSFGQRREHHGNLMGRGFQPVQGRVAPGSERRVASLAAKGLDLLGTAILAISNESVDVILCDAEVRTLRVGTSEAIGGYPLGGSPPAFHLTPGAYWRWCRSHHSRVGAAEATGGAVQRGAWLEVTVQWGACTPYL